MTLITRLRDLHLRACHIARPDPAPLAEFVYGLAHSDELGVLTGVIEPYLPLLGEAGLSMIRRKLAADERRMRGYTDIGRAICEFRLGPIRAALGQLPLN